MEEDLKKEVVKAFYIDNSNGTEISKKFNIPQRVVNKIIYDDASNGFRLLNIVKEELHGKT